MMRIVFGGSGLDGFEPSPHADSYIKAQFLPAGAPFAPPFSDDDTNAADPAYKPRNRRYTVRGWNADTRELTIDFVSHGDVGYAGSWAQRAQIGDRLQFTGPSGGYSPNPDASWHLLVGDESALPAIAVALERMHPDATVDALVVVDGASNELAITSPAQVNFHWLHRMGADEPQHLLLRAVEGLDAARFSGGNVDVFVHGEAGEVREVRKFLITERGVNRDDASMSPYWRRTFTDEDWRQVKREWVAAMQAEA